MPSVCFPPGHKNCPLHGLPLLPAVAQPTAEHCGRATMTLGLFQQGPTGSRLPTRLRARHQQRRRRHAFARARSATFLIVPHVWLTAYVPSSQELCAPHSPSLKPWLSSLKPWLSSLLIPDRRLTAHVSTEAWIFAVLTLPPSGGHLAARKANPPKLRAGLWQANAAAENCRGRYAGWRSTCIGVLEWASLVRWLRLKHTHTVVLPGVYAGIVFIGVTVER